MSKSEKKIVLKSSDGETFEVEEAVALQSQTIAHIVEDDCARNIIPLDNVTGQILAKVIEYCKKHVVVADGDGGGSSPSSKEELKNWDDEFVKDMDQSMLFEVILAANYLNANSLLALTCQFAADTMVIGKSVDEIRTTFNMENDFTPEEEEEIRKEKQWVFDK